MLLRCGQLNCETGAAVFAHNADTALVQLHDSFDNGEAYAVALAVMGFICLVEFIPNLAQLGLGNVLAVVCDADFIFLSGFGNCKLYFTGYG